MGKSSIVIIFSLLSSIAFAAFMPSFKANKYYLADGRWIIHQGNHLFKINEGNGNEEVITFKGNKLSLAHMSKYKLCFKVVSDCHLACKGELIKNIKALDPWDQLEPLASNSDNTHPESQIEACQKNE